MSGTKSLGRDSISIDLYILVWYNRSVVLILYM